MSYETIQYEVADNVASITLNRPDKMNAFNQQMLDEFVDVWSRIRVDDDVHAVVLRANGDRAFCTGVDVVEVYDRGDELWGELDPGSRLAPKANQVWKPVICAVHGMAAGGAFYWINESDIVICASDTTFFDPHVSYGLVAALEPIGLTHRIPLGEALRIALVGLDERVTAARAEQIGLVSEVVEGSREAVWARAAELAARIAAKPAAATQGTVKAIWESLDMTRSGGQQVGLLYTQLGNPVGTAQVDRATLARPQWEPR
ncbi:MAG TPA: enoyl-CoA hydratase/isomerase family protein [Mycobacteriales bacterium]|nr:enoyl-CoA hydratase/isomerase family protein [Mycobacteriales bacterium]